MSWKTTFFVASRVPGRVRATGSPRTRPGGSPDRSGQGAQTGASTKRASSPGDRRQIASRTDVPEALDARGRSFAKRMHSGASSGRSPSRPVSRAAPVRPLCRRSVVGGRAGPGIGRARAVLGRTGLAGRASLVTSSTSGREAVCHRSGGAPGIGQTPSSSATPDCASDSPDFGFSYM